MTSTLFIQLLKMAETASDEVPRAMIREAIGVNDVELRGLVFAMIHNQHIRNRIKPPLEMADFQKLHFSYLLDCIKSPIDSEWCEDPYLAGHGIVAWFQHLWQQKLENMDYLIAWKHALADLYIQGDEAIRDVVINGIMEHLFLDDEIRLFFDDWRGHATLEKAYDKSLPSVSGIQQGNG